jgi:hypothetical protein
VDSEAASERLWPLVLAEDDDRDLVGGDPFPREALEGVLAWTTGRIERQDQLLRSIDSDHHLVVGDRAGSDHRLGQPHQDRPSALDLCDQILERPRNDEGLEALGARHVPQRPGPHPALRGRIERGQLIERRGHTEVAQHHRQGGRSTVRV